MLHCTWRGLRLKALSMELKMLLVFYKRYPQRHWLCRVYIYNIIFVVLQGIAANAQPQQLLLEKLSSMTGNDKKSPYEDQLKKSSKSNKMRILFDNGEVQFNAKVGFIVTPYRLCNVIYKLLIFRFLT